MRVCGVWFHDLFVLSLPGGIDAHSLSHRTLHSGSEWTRNCEMRIERGITGLLGALPCVTG